MTDGPPDQRGAGHVRAAANGARRAGRGRGRRRCERLVVRAAEPLASRCPGPAEPATGEAGPPRVAGRPLRSPRRLPRRPCAGRSWAARAAPARPRPGACRGRAGACGGEGPAGGGARARARGGRVARRGCGLRAGGGACSVRGCEGLREADGTRAAEEGPEASALVGGKAVGPAAGGCRGGSRPWVADAPPGSVPYLGACLLLVNVVVFRIYFACVCTDAAFESPTFVKTGASLTGSI